MLPVKRKAALCLQEITPLQTNRIMWQIPLANAETRAHCAEMSKSPYWAFMKPDERERLGQLAIDRRANQRERLKIYDRCRKRAKVATIAP
jgi:hypothetical protein